MGLLVNGEWRDGPSEAEGTDGAFRRRAAGFRNWITADGAPGPTGQGGFRAESGRYHLYVSLACPWAHRTLIFRKLKGLEEHVSLDVVHPLMLQHGWVLSDGYPGATGDRVLGKRFLHEVYTTAAPDVTTRVTVPVLWDKERATIVSNESSEIVRMFNSSFDAITGNRQDFYPADLRAAIDAINASVYEHVNNGVYKSGFATTQAAYDTAVRNLFAELDRLERLLSEQRYAAGDTITEADWRLFPTLLRFDPVYVGHFKCNIRRLVDYPALWSYTRELHQWPGVRSTVDMDHIRLHYHGSHETINPHGIVPAGPEIHFDEPHGREALSPG